MKRTLLQLQYSRLLGLYYKLNKRLQKHFAAGRFHQFDKTRQQNLINRIERLKAQLSILENRAKLAGAVLLIGAVLHSADCSAQITASGSEFLVNTYTVNNQLYTSIASDSAGDFVVVWESYNEAGGGSQGDIYAQRYNASGAKEGSEFLVNTYTKYNQSAPSVAMDGKGDFVVTWDSYNQDGSKGGVYAKRYTSAGAVKGAEFLVNTFTYNNQGHPSACMDSKGDFVIAWQSLTQDGSGYGIYAKHFDSSGTAQSSEFLVNTFTTGIQKKAKTAMDNQGDFVITWNSYAQVSANSLYDIYARHYDATGAAQTSIEFLINTDTTGYQQNPTVAMDSAGDFVVAWQSNFTAGSYCPTNIIAQRFSASGVAAGAQFIVSTSNTYYIKSLPATAMDSKGDFVVAWESSSQDGDAGGVYARSFNTSGVAQDNDFLVNTYTTSDQVFPAATMDNRGDFVITWESYNEASSASNYDVYAQRYTVGSTTTAITNQTSVNLFNLYPNPAQGQVQISLNGNASVRVMDMTGHVLLEQPLQGNTLNISNLNAGMYMVEVTQNSVTEVMKLIVQQ